MPLEEFAANLTELVGGSVALGARVAVQAPAVVTPSARTMRPDLRSYAAVCREVAVGWLDDPIHPNAEGHRRVAELLLDRLGLGAGSGG